MIKICEECGAEYEVRKGQENRSRFCSDACSRKSRNTQIQYICDYCGNPFLVRNSKVERRKNGLSKHLCCSSECAQNVQKPKWKDIQQLFFERGYDLKSTTYASSKTKLEYVCQSHPEKGSQYITYNNLRHGCGCRFCGMESTAKSRRLAYDEVKQIFAKNDMDLLEGQVYTSTSDLMAYICRHHKNQGVQYMTTSNAYRNHCPHCRKSKGEGKISTYLSENAIEYISQYKIDGLVGVRGHKLSYDFYLPHYNALIEYQGEFHDGTVKGLQSELALQTQQEHDRRKRTFAYEHNINLLEIWYYDFHKIEHILDEYLQLN